MELEKTEEIEINLKEIFYVLLDKIWVLFYAALICALLGGIVTKLTEVPVYSSITKLYVINRQDPDKTITSTDLSAGSLLIKDFEILVTSRPILEQVLHNLNVKMSQEELAGEISVNIPEETRILEITVKDKDPFMAKRLADEIADVSAEQMISVMDIEKVSVVERGRIPTLPTENKFAKNILLGGVLGIGISIAAIIIIYLGNDRIKNNEDIEKYLGIIPLAEIPLEEDILNTRRVRAELKKAYKKGYKGGLNNAVG
ncbi:YveK family protein [Anaerocolumna xylanovorans]|uniref:Capsular polysaccharide biosynthesis protein n=1 Tax=Anaerocolumna xylanovorans DSM 12503 TaxID=1121345 RepID=A0A1M7YA92_9FIRM|nr:Wzz/FepE/Etk N-terminal domain-containing protein [Anaerocolumna xylanovorans]SHO49552.1 Capsular polysaccharide biosynthesis protein [Anaerocolumna xylanovorans DSM 12503]